MTDSVVYFEQSEIEKIKSNHTGPFKPTHVLQDSLKGEVRVMNLRDKKGRGMTIKGHSQHRFFITSAGEYLLLDLQLPILKKIH